MMRWKRVSFWNVGILLACASFSWLRVKPVIAETASVNTWESIADGTDKQLWKVEWIKGMYVAAGPDGIIRQLTDGVTRALVQISPIYSHWNGRGGLD